MNSYLLIASIITFLLGLVHSVLGEIMILRHLPNVEGFPPIAKSKRLPKWTIRITWHITTILGWAIAIILAYFSQYNPLDNNQLFIIKVLDIAFFASFVVSLIGTRARHPSWIAFLILALLCLRVSI